MDDAQHLVRHRDDGALVTTPGGKAAVLSLELASLGSRRAVGAFDERDAKGPGTRAASRLAALAAGTFTVCRQSAEASWDPDVRWIEWYDPVNDLAVKTIYYDAVVELSDYDLVE